LNTGASNLANADTAAAPGEEPYRARQVLFRADASVGGAASGNSAGGHGVSVAAVREDPAPARRVFDPHHPYADGEGYGTMSNVNAVEQMVDMISAARSYQSNVEVMNTAKNLLSKTLSLGS
ncbi:MAG: flagellar basal body rod protein FlgC, partial [Betaproteobacteria bacterium]|nr:flagellar basal body rod protein FlgC [Betaproteobacteria bacterium]